MSQDTDFATFSRAWRARLGVTRAEGADLLGIPLRTLEGYELGRDPPIWRALQLAMRQVEREWGIPVTVRRSARPKPLRSRSAKRRKR